jgi:hypothetical protein
MTLQASEAPPVDNLPLPLDRLALFGPAPLIEGESSRVYDALLARISGAVNPSDIFEEMWTRDVVDYSWQAFRLRRSAANLVNGAAYECLERVLLMVLDEKPDPFLPDDFFESKSKRLAHQWALRNRDAVAEVEELLRSVGLSIDQVMAQATALVLSDFERIERMAMAAGARRDAILREIERHRATFGQQLRRASQEAEIEDLKAIEMRSVAGGGMSD